ncbi:BAG family molecular chaperone regulator 4 [Dryobates pubescens]|uniref:BAG family molecular chaperone regulator 4 n=1 Tax=Dryobates pubescens TaxID=118200 RepID=UPI0023B99B39|nr:BAG family molecular chaperone regulator 4 [Dryobates pubescens]
MEPRGRAAERGPPWPPESSRPLAAQVMDSPYANGAYTPPYPAAPSAAPHYASLPQPRGYYCSGAPYPTEPTGMYRPPSPAPPWSYAPQDCPTERSSLRRQQVPGYSPPQTPGMPIPQYPYGDNNPGITAQGPPPQPRPPEDSWAPPTAYGVQPRYGWHTAPGHGNPFVSESHSPWAASGAPAHPPAWDPKLQDYDKPEQGTNHHSYYSDVNQQHSGTISDQRPGSTKPAPCKAKVQYSAQPQLYEAAPRKPAAGSREVGFRPAEQPSPHVQPEIQRVLQVMGEAEQLEQEVDEFVGRKTDKAYRLLEEMLTKLLLELDSIETGGQDTVRQARKESVHRVQAILEKLERKGL